MKKLALLLVITAAACTTGTGANLRVNDVRYAGSAERCDAPAPHCETATKLLARATSR